ncbi:MAG: type II secretion system protein GspG [Chthoniobacterales bacterium]
MKPASPRSAQKSAALRRRGAFTLIELLVVISIIVILAGLLIQTAGFVQEKAARSLTESQLKAIESALMTYKLDNGTFPPQLTPVDTSTKVLIQELALNPIQHPEQYGYRKPFEIPVKMLSAYKPGTHDTYETLLGKSDSLVDAFGNPYHYQFPGMDKRNGVTTFDLFSKGKKNQGGDTETDTSITSKWIKNW